MSAPDHQAADHDDNNGARERRLQQPGTGLDTVPYAPHVAMLRYVQRTAGNQAVNALLRQYQIQREAAETSNQLPATPAVGLESGSISSAVSDFIDAKRGSGTVVPNDTTGASPEGTAQRTVQPEPPTAGALSRQYLQRDFPGDLGLQPPPKPTGLPGGLDPNDPNTVQLGHGPNPFQPGANAPGPTLDIGIMPNPADPFEKPPTNWESLAGSVVGPDHPEAWNGVTHPALTPLPKLGLDGKPASKVSPQQQQDADAALHAFESSYQEANSTWNAIIALVADFAEASKEVEGAGDLGAQGGMLWNPGTPGADLSTLAGQQKVGLNSETTVNDLFKKNKDGTVGTDTNVDSTGVHGSKDTKVLVNAAVAAANELNTARGAQKTAADGIVKTKLDMTNAIRLVKMNDDQTQADKDGAKQRELQAAKEKAISDIEPYYTGAESLTLIGFGIFDAVGSGHPVEGAESVLIGVEIAAEAIHKAAIAEEYDPKIQELEGKIRASLAGLRSKQDLYVEDNLKSAELGVKMAFDHFRQASATVKAKMAAVQKTYYDLGKEAGKAAGGGQKGARIAAAIEAIPKVEIVVARAGHLADTAKIPIYTDTSGKGFNGFNKPQDFTTHLGLLKGYRDKFQGLRTVWKGRLDSLMAVAKRFD